MWTRFRLHVRLARSQPLLRARSLSLSLCLACRAPSLPFIACTTYENLSADRSVPTICLSVCRTVYYMVLGVESWSPCDHHYIGTERPREKSRKKREGGHRARKRPSRPRTYPEKSMREKRQTETRQAEAEAEAARHIVKYSYDSASPSSCRCSKPAALFPSTGSSPRL